MTNKERKAAINRLQDAIDGYKEYLTDEALNMGIQALEQTTWIPTSERLPEDAYGCLVTVYDTDLRTQDEFENILPYFVGYDGETWNNADGEPIPFEVIAWQPLPKPFEPQESEEEIKKLKEQPAKVYIDKTDYQQGYIDGVNQMVKELKAERQPCEDVVSRQAVLDLAYDMSEIDGEHFTEPCMVVDVEDIQKLPSVQRTSNADKKHVENTLDDAISRQAVMDALCDDCELYKNGEKTCFAKCEEYHFLATLPPVTPQPKTGHWIKHIDHTDCIWYGSDSGCPVTCSQYRDG